jgi:hypothetical protein
MGQSVLDKLNNKCYTFYVTDNNRVCYKNLGYTKIRHKTWRTRQNIVAGVNYPKGWGTKLLEPNPA